MRRPKVGETGWHVFARGARRLALFREDSDYREFLSILQACLGDCALWAYALMTNHYHLVVYATSEELSRCMMRVNHAYSVYHNQKYGLSGHAFDGPYKAYRQRTVLWLFWKLAYVFLNPVAAGLVKRPEEYRWSSCASFLGVGEDPLRIDPVPVLNLMDPLPDRSRSHFRWMMEQEAGRSKRGGKSTPVAFDIQRAEFEWLIQHARAMGEKLEGQRPEGVALFWGKQCGIPPRVMAEVLGKDGTAGISQRLHQLRQRIKSRPGLQPVFTLP